MRSEIWYNEEIDATVRIILPDKKDWRAYCDLGKEKWDIKTLVSLKMGARGPENMKEMGFSKIINIEC